jgi:hypothetical protein
MEELLDILFEVLPDVIEVDAGRDLTMKTVRCIINNKGNTFEFVDTGDTIKEAELRALEECKKLAGIK